MVSSLSNQVFTIPFVGDYNVKNALIAIIIGLKFGLSINQISEGLARTELTQSRSEWLTTWNGAQMFSDVYNANPTAMKLVLETIARVENQGKNSRFSEIWESLGIHRLSYIKVLPHI